MRPSPVVRPRLERFRLGLLCALATLLCTTSLGCGGTAPDVDRPTVSFLKQRQRWTSTAASATVHESAPGEWTIQVVARRDPEGEQLTLMAMAPEVLGTHPLSAFGSLRGFDRAPDTALPATNVCGAQERRGDHAETGAVGAGTLTVESHDPDARTLSGSFIVHMCDVQERSDVETLGDGVFRLLSYPPPS